MAVVQERVNWMKEGLPGAKATPKGNRKKVWLNVMQPTGSDAILSEVLGSKPGMTKKTIILWNAPKNIKQIMKVLLFWKENKRGARGGSGLFRGLQDTHGEDSWGQKAMNVGKREDRVCFQLWGTIHNVSFWMFLKI